MGVIKPQGHFNKRYSDGKGNIKLTLDDYVDFNLSEYNAEDLQNAFLDWVKDTSYFKTYEQWEILKDNQIMFRVFRFEKEHSSGFMAQSGKPLMQLKILPFGKVIRSTSKRFDVGDIIALPDDLTEIETNGTWLEWKKVIDNERPVPDLPEPPRYVGKIVDWRRNHKFVGDKFNPSMDDEYTFLMNDFEFSVKLKT